MFSHVQETLHHVNRKRVVLESGVHKDLNNLQWISKEMYAHMIRLYKLAPLTPTVDIYHDVSGCMCGGITLPVPAPVT